MHTYYNNYNNNSYNPNQMNYYKPSVSACKNLVWNDYFSYIFTNKDGYYPTDPYKK